ncbi:MAG: L-rhamnose mutarotase [Planctomycetota bacterium]
MKRYGSVIGLNKERAKEYVELHAEVWPSVLDMIRACHFRNYSIYMRQLPDGNLYLFSYFEYVGDDFATDSAKMAADPETQRWWDICKPCQKQLPDAGEGEWWASMEEVFHID